MSVLNGYQMVMIMNKLTYRKAVEMLQTLDYNRDHGGLSIREEFFYQALEIAAEELKRRAIEEGKNAGIDK